MPSLDFYSTLSKTYEDPIKTVGWRSEWSQRLRFQAMLLLDDFSGHSVLDCGAGLGAFYGFLQEEEIDCDYTGLDQVPEMVSRAREQHPGANFRVQDVFSESFQGDFDYVVASGLMSVKVEDPMPYIESSIQKLFSLSRLGLGFNLLSTFMPDTKKQSRFMYFEPEKILAFCLSLSPYVTLHHHYLKDDFTVFIYPNL